MQLRMCINMIKYLTNQENVWARVLSEVATEEAKVRELIYRTVLEHFILALYNNQNKSKIEGKTSRLDFDIFTDTLAVVSDLLAGNATSRSLKQLFIMKEIEHLYKVSQNTGSDYPLIEYCGKSNEYL